MTFNLKGSTATWWWDCGLGCPPIRLRFPVVLVPLSVGGDGTAQMQIEADFQHPLNAGAVRAHMAGVHA